VDFVLAEIRQLYEELNKFWAQEVLCVGEALNKNRFDRRDLERWNKFNPRLKQIIESWKVLFYFFAMHSSLIQISCSESASRR
jgi:hypothetical protein